MLSGTPPPPVRSRTVAEPDLIIHDEHGIRRITLNRAEAANAITPDQRDDLIATLEEASGRPEVRVVVLAAAGEGVSSFVERRDPDYRGY